MPVECDYCLGNAEDDEIYVNECSGFSGSCWGHVCDNCCWETNRLMGLLTRNPQMKIAFDALLNKDLAVKLSKD